MDYLAVTLGVLVELSVFAVIALCLAFCVGYTVSEHFGGIGHLRDKMKVLGLIK